jgi:hypothetical protein
MCIREAATACSVPTLPRVLTGAEPEQTHE